MYRLDLEGLEMKMGLVAAAEADGAFWGLQGSSALILRLFSLYWKASPCARIRSSVNKKQVLKNPPGSKASLNAILLAS